MNELLILSLSLSLSLSKFCYGGQGSLEVSYQKFPKSFQFLTLVSEHYNSTSPPWLKTWSNSQNLEKIAALSKITDCHEHTLQEI